MTTDRIPLTRSVHYAVRGMPEVPNQYGPGALAPCEITLTYRDASDSQLGRVHAYVAGRIWVDGKELPLLPGGLYGQHYFDGLDGWPEWLAEEARLHDPAVSPVPPPADRAALRDRIAEALMRWAEGNNDQRYASMRRPETVRANAYSRADAVLAVLPEPADRAAVLAEAIRRVEDPVERAKTTIGLGLGWESARDVLRRMAAEEQPAVGEQPETQETLPPSKGPEYTPCACDHIEPEHEPNAGACWSCDCEAYRPAPAAPLLSSEDACPGFPERCPNLRPVDPNPPAHLGGVRCGCADTTDGAR
ncbi:hypothetical protein [Streptomyces sp. NPDC052015]|uniref:hypothetical protein n=1 Tax=Streptomyces sp. NPDC052015 TaxID=3154755 RepID=UPI00343271C4